MIPVVATQSYSAGENMPDRKFNLGSDGELSEPILIIPEKPKKRPRPGCRLSLLLTLLALVLGVIAIAILVVIRSSPKVGITVPGGAETLIIPFDKLNPTLTEQKYSSKVTLSISGTGQAANTAFSDAFYLYTTDQGTPLELPVKEAFDLEIDGQRAIITLGLRENPPPLAPDHTYTVTYDVGSTPRQIAFRISDSIVDDNAGQFVIKISKPKQ
jgi:hypothetical protein